MNGNTIAANIYFNDDVTYTGTAGSETNPYCIEDFWDLVLCSSYPDSLNPFNLNHTDMYALLVKDIDMNDYPDITTQIMNGTVTYKYTTYTFTFTSFNLLWAQIDGAGYCLRNLCVYGNTFGSSPTNGIFYKYATSFKLKIKNLNIINFISYTNNSLFSTYGEGTVSSLTFEKCNFGVYYYNLTNGFISSLICSQYIHYSKFEKCTFNFKGSCHHMALLGNRDYGTKPTFNLCHINIDKMNGMGCLFNCRTSEDYTKYGGTYFTYITGRMRNVVITTSSETSVFLVYYGVTSSYVLPFFNKFIMNYVNIKLEYDKTAPPQNLKITSTSTAYPSPAPNVINETNLIDGAYPLAIINKGSDTNIRHITDTQLKDPVFLNSIGFSVYDSN